jgi:hypothetical protein
MRSGDYSISAGKSKKEKRETASGKIKSARQERRAPASALERS